MSEKVKLGYWSVATQKHLKVFQSDSTGLSNLGSLNLAGKVGRFLGAIRGNKDIRDLNKLLVIANSVGISSKAELVKLVLPEVAKASEGRVELITNNLGEITGLLEFLYDQSMVLEVSGQVFENSYPSEVERIVVETMDETKKIPYLQDELIQTLTKMSYKERDISLSLALQTQFRLIQILNKRKSQEAIISNEYVWGKDHKKVAMAVANLGLKEREEIKDIIDIFHKTQGFPLERLAPETLEFLNLAKKIGMITPMPIQSRRGFQKEFGFSANFLKPQDYKDDILDDVKLLLASIRFGENYTPHSTIQDPKDFLSYLINNKDIGPHPANSTDYFLLEKRGIVRVVNKTKTKYSRYYEDWVQRTGPCLELLREDVAIEALKVISSPDYQIPKDTEISDFGSIMDLSSCLSPEEARLNMGETTEAMEEVNDEALRMLRGELL
ncbi:hypothetical protein AMQ83_35165 [Paenibacillus riograndensis]|nr:hypothetical protein AMQ83_35165 [Paenibacillus riograndensis]